MKIAYKMVEMSLTNRPQALEVACQLSVDNNQDFEKGETVFEMSDGSFVLFDADSARTVENP